MTTWIERRCAGCHQMLPIDQFPWRAAYISAPRHEKMRGRFCNACLAENPNIERDDTAPFDEEFEEQRHDSRYRS